MVTTRRARSPVPLQFPGLPKLSLWSPSPAPPRVSLQFSPPCLQWSPWPLPLPSAPFRVTSSCPSPFRSLQTLSPSLRFSPNPPSPFRSLQHPQLWCPQPRLCAPPPPQAPPFPPRRAFSDPGQERPLASAHAHCSRLQSPPKGPSRLRAGRPRSGPPARSVSLVLPVTSDLAAAGRGGEALALGGRRLLQRDPGAGPGAARAAGRCESGRSGAGTRRLHRGRVAPRRAAVSTPSLGSPGQAGGGAPGLGAGIRGERAPRPPHSLWASRNSPDSPADSGSPNPPLPFLPWTHHRISWSPQNPLTRSANLLCARTQHFSWMPPNASTARKFLGSLISLFLHYPKCPHPKFLLMFPQTSSYVISPHSPSNSCP